MDDPLMIFDEIVLIIDIFLLFYFSSIKASIKVLRFLYLIFGITLIPVGMLFISLDYPLIQYIWFFIFSLTGFIVSIHMFIKYNRIKGTSDEDKFNEEFKNKSIKQGKRHLAKNISRIGK